MRRRPPSWLPPPAPFTQSWCALIHISPETRIITRPRSLIGHGRHLISFLLANLQNSFNSKCNGDWLRLIKVKLFKMLNLHSLLSHLTCLPLRPFISANKIRHLSTVNQSDSREQLRRCTCEHVTRCDAPLSRDTPPMCHTSHVTRPRMPGMWLWPHWSPCDDSDPWLAESILSPDPGWVTWWQS